MNVNDKLPYEAPVANLFPLSAGPLHLCVQFSANLDIGDYQEGEAL